MNIGIKNCPLCEIELVSEISKGCKMCGMPLDYEDEIFCSKRCENVYEEIYENDNQ